MPKQILQRNVRGLLMTNPSAARAVLANVNHTLGENLIGQPRHGDQEVIGQVDRCRIAGHSPILTEAMSHPMTPDWFGCAAIYACTTIRHLLQRCINADKCIAYLCWTKRFWTLCLDTTGAWSSSCKPWPAWMLRCAQSGNPMRA